MTLSKTDPRALAALAPGESGQPHDAAQHWAPPAAPLDMPRQVLERPARARRLPAALAAVLGRPTHA